MFENTFSANDRSALRVVPVDDRYSREQSLVAAAKQGRSVAFDELCRPHAKRLLQMTYRITKNREDSEDALQDSFLRAFMYLKDFDGRSTFSTWLTRIAKNSALMILRKKRICREVALEDSDDRESTTPRIYEVPDSRPNPEKHYAARERARILRRAIVHLRPKIRRVVELQQLQEHSLGHTAQVLGISLAAAKGRLFHARAALRKSPALTAIRQNRRARRVRILSAA